jgi:hypothetical protein
MKTLTNYKLLVDADCPMCRLYGNAFENAGMIERGTCSPYQTIDVSFAKMIDMTRAKNEIALLNTQTNEVVYGLNAIELIVGTRFELLAKVFQNQVVNVFLSKLYKFISMNRKVIAPTAINHEARTCVPDVNVKYRAAYMAFVVFFSAFVLYHYTQPINNLLGFKSHLGRELLVCVGQIVWQVAFLHKLLKNKLLDYLGNMMTVSLIGTILLFLPMTTGYFLNGGGWFYLIHFVIVVGIMFVEHLRRSHILGIGYWPTVSWLLYRGFGATLIYFFN